MTRALGVQAFGELRRFVCTRAPLPTSSCWEHPCAIRHWCHANQWPVLRKPPCGRDLLSLSVPRQLSLVFSPRDLSLRHPTRPCPRPGNLEFARDPRFRLLGGWGVQPPWSPRREAEAEHVTPLRAAPFQEGRAPRTERGGHASEFPETAESQGARHMGSAVLMALGVGLGFGGERERERRPPRPPPARGA